MYCSCNLKYPNYQLQVTTANLKIPESEKWLVTSIAQLYAWLFSAMDLRSHWHPEANASDPTSGRLSGWNCNDFWRNCVKSDLSAWILRQNILGMVEVEVQQFFHWGRSRSGLCVAAVRGPWKPEGIWWYRFFTPLRWLGTSILKG